MYDLILMLLTLAVAFYVIIIVIVFVIVIFIIIISCQSVLMEAVGSDGCLLHPSKYFLFLFLSTVTLASRIFFLHRGQLLAFLSNISSSVSAACRWHFKCLCSAASVHHVPLFPMLFHHKGPLLAVFHVVTCDTEVDS